MKFNRSAEIRQIFNEAAESENALMEQQRLLRMQQIFVDEFSERLGSIGILNAKLDKILDKLNNKE